MSEFLSASLAAVIFPESPAARAHCAPEITARTNAKNPPSIITKLKIATTYLAASEFVIGNASPFLNSEKGTVICGVQDITGELDSLDEDVVPSEGGAEVGVHALLSEEHIPLGTQGVALRPVPGLLQTFSLFSQVLEELSRTTQHPSALTLNIGNKKKKIPIMKKITIFIFLSFLILT
jgi:hypothetical protein